MRYARAALVAAALLLTGCGNEPPGVSLEPGTPSQMEVVAGTSGNDAVPATKPTSPGRRLVNEPTTVKAGSASPGPTTSPATDSPSEKPVEVEPGTPIVTPPVEVEPADSPSEKPSPQSPSAESPSEKPAESPSEKPAESPSPQSPSEEPAYVLVERNGQMYPACPGGDADKCGIPKPVSAVGCPSNYKPDCSGPAPTPERPPSTPRSPEQKPVARGHPALACA